MTSPGDILRLGLLGLRTRRLRAVLSALGISIGIATIVLVTGIPASSNAALQERLAALGTNVLEAEPLPNPQGQAVQLPEDSAGMAERIGPVTDAAQTADTHAAVQRTDKLDPGESSGIAALATSPDLLKVLNGHILTGSFLTATTANFPAVVLGYVAAGWLGIDRAGAQIYVGGHWFAVVGILGPMPLAPDVERSVLVGWGAARAELGFDGHPTAVYVQADERAVEAVRDVLPATLYPPLAGLVAVSRPSDALAAKLATESNFSALFLGLAAVALLVGGVGVANTMVVSVLERRGEIGLRRALGASRGQIRAQFLTEAAVLSALGGLTGTVLGVLATVGYAAYQRWPVTIPVPALAGGIGSAVLVGVVAGLYPSIRAARLTPTEALATV